MKGLKCEKFTSESQENITDFIKDKDVRFVCGGKAKWHEAVWVFYK